MSNLESIVPPLELCKRIPAGEFEDSALAWYNHGVPILRWRDNLEKLDGVQTIPAPTLEETGLAPHSNSISCSFFSASFMLTMSW